MKKLGLALPLMIFPGAAALAQPGYTSQCLVVQGLPAYGAGTFQPITCSTDGTLATRIVGSVSGTFGVTQSGPFSVSPSASAGGGAIGVQILSAASNNAQNIKPNPGTLYVSQALNTNSTTAYLKFYDTSGVPQCGTTTPKFTLPLVQNVPMPLPPSPVGVSFTSGIGVCIVANQAATDNTSATTGISVSLIYQ